MVTRPGQLANEGRVVVAMSGGVDSSVAAALLVERGYQVAGMMMRLWSEPSRLAGPANRCCTPEQMADARRVADRLNIPFYVLDVQQQFYQTVVQFFVEEHAQGRTPNPCLECNRLIRFTYLLDKALATNASYLATGHYAQIERSSDGPRLKRAVDRQKDQSYVLHMLSQERLEHVLLPVGAFNKVQVRQLAAGFGLPVASKQESQDLCFLSDGDYRRFLRQQRQDLTSPGPILSSAGIELGRHQGLAFYTIGQRKGLGISAPAPLYVLRKDSARNALIVGPKEQLGQQSLAVRDVNWIAGQPPVRALACKVQVRYRARAVPATVVPLSGGRAQVRFNTPVPGITPGQGAVFYEDDTCLGGGLIDDQRWEDDQSLPPSRPLVVKKALA